VRQLSFGGDGSSSDLAIGGTRQLRAVATMSDGTSQDVTSLATWRSTNPQVASVVSGLVRALSAGTSDIVVQYADASGALPVRVSASGTHDDPPPPGSTPDPAPSPVPGGLTITGSGLMSPGSTSQLQVTQRMSDGSTRDVTANSDYTSDNPAVVTTSSSGNMTAVGPGVTTVRAQYGGSSATLPVIVSPVGNFF